MKALKLIWLVPLSAIRMSIFIVGAAFLVLLHHFINLFKPTLFLAKFWHKFACWILGIRVHVYGTPCQNSPEYQNNPVLYVSNHLSYADICVLSSIMNVVFVAKSEVRDWPIFGYLSFLQKTVYIRRLRTALADAIVDVKNSLSSGRNVVLFAEGTSTNGESVVPFKAGLFEMAYVLPTLQIQPIAIVIESINGNKNITPQMRNNYAWWRLEDTLFPHLLRLAATWRTDIGVHFMPPLSPQDEPERKALALKSQQAIEAVINRANA